MISAVLPDLTSPPPTTHFTNPASTVLPPPRHPHQSEVPPSPPLSPHPRQITRPPTSPSSKLAGIVGLFSGFGALLALAVFLPLPTLLDASRRPSNTPEDPTGSITGTGTGLKRSYWIIAIYAVVCGIACWLGLPHYGGDVQNRRTRNGTARSLIGGDISRWWQGLFGKRRREEDSLEAERLLSENPAERQARRQNRPSALRMLIRALKVGYDRWRTIGISYIGGFIARYIPPCSPLSHFIASSSPASLLLIA